MVTFKDILLAYCKEGSDLNIQLLNPDVVSTGVNFLKQDLIHIVRLLEMHCCNVVFQFETNMKSGATLIFSGAEVEEEVCSSSVPKTKPTRVLEELCNRYQVIAWIDGQDKIYTLGYGMVIYDERPMSQ
jgi:hypothetical protein